MNYDIILVGLLIIIEFAVFLFFFLHAYEKRTSVLIKGYCLRNKIYLEKKEKDEKTTQVL